MPAPKIVEDFKPPMIIENYKPDDPVQHPDDPDRFNKAQVKQNPFPHMGKWYWFDETGAMSKPFPNQMAALKDLLAYCEWLNNGPTLWQSIWWPTRYYAGLFWKMLRS